VRVNAEWRFRDPKHKEVSCLCNTYGGEVAPSSFEIGLPLEPAMELTILMLRLKEALTLIGNHDA
jgi:hypothetical protein